MTTKSKSRRRKPAAIIAKQSSITSATSTPPNPPPATQAELADNFSRLADDVDLATPSSPHIKAWAGNLYLEVERQLVAVACEQTEIVEGPQRGLLKFREIDPDKMTYDARTQAHLFRTARAALSDLRAGNVTQDAANKLRAIAARMNGQGSWPRSPLKGADGMASEPRREEAKAFPPLAFVDQKTGESYTFGGRRLLWELWKALFSARRRLNFSELPNSVESWNDSVLEDGTVRGAAKELRALWKKHNRPDFAKRITCKASTIGLEPTN
jgi:hypothetical protein